MYAVNFEQCHAKKVVVSTKDCCPPPPPRVPQIYKEVVKVPGEPGQVKEVVKRLPTPTPDIIDKTIIEQPGQDTINVIYERPTTPPPNIVERRLIEAPPAPQVNCFERRVPHRPRETIVQESTNQILVPQPSLCQCAAPCTTTVVAAAPVPCCSRSSLTAIEQVSLPLLTRKQSIVIEPAAICSRLSCEQPICTSQVITRRPSFVSVEQPLTTFVETISGTNCLLRKSSHTILL